MSCGSATCSSIAFVPQIALRRPAPNALKLRASAFLSALARAAARRRQRHALRELDDHLLSDIGVSRAEALREAGKPPWK